MTRIALLALIPASFAATAALADVQTPLEDPMNSGMWEIHQQNLLGDPADIRFDDRVIVRGPGEAEDTVNVPLLVDASAIDNVDRIVISADYGPIPHIMTYYPGTAEAKIALRFKIDMASTIRASVRTHDGSWHIGSTYIDAAGGGCSAPATAYANSDWYDKLGEIHGQVWPASGRARMVIDHPMDTGLAGDIPVFIIEDLYLRDEDGTELAHLELFEPVNEDPAFTVYFDPATMPTALHVDGRDNNGNEIEGLLQPADTH